MIHFKRIILFIWFMIVIIIVGHAVWSSQPGLSLVSMSRDYSLIVVHGFLIAAASLVAEHGL